MSRVCPHCGATLGPVADAFCPNCRSALDEPPVLQPPTPTIAEERHQPRIKVWLIAGTFEIFAFVCVAVSTDREFQQTFGPMAHVLGGFGGLLLLLACSVIAVAKGRSPLWGVLGILSCIGLAVVAILPGAPVVESISREDEP